MEEGRRTWHALRRGLPRQRPRRERERSVRQDAVAFARWLEWRGRSGECAARSLGMSPGTLAEWVRRWKEDRMTIRARGRPPDHAEGELRRAILAVFGLMGPHVGLPTLQDLFPEVARGELVELQRRYRYAFRRRNRFLLYVLRWTRAGAVWAMDFAEPPAPTDGIYTATLCVRDLGSKLQLAALPVPDETAMVAIRLLDALVRWFGLPLVLKVDNGPAFISEELEQWAKSHGVLLLFSPRGTPAYNGAIEAGIGSIHARAHHEAARHDRPGDWTCDDIEAARLQANETARPWGRFGNTPREAWDLRLPIRAEERADFHETYRNFYEAERASRGILPGARLQHREQASIDRVAISRALIEQGFLLVRRRRITLPIWKRFARKIS